MEPLSSAEQEAVLDTPHTEVETRVPAAPNNARTGLLLAVLVVAALALRLWGITWSLPNQDRLFTYHPDEGVNLINGVFDRDRIPRPHLDLRFYNYGSLYFYLWQSASAVNRAYGFTALPATGSPDKPDAESFATLILVGRLVTALLGALTVIPIFSLGRRFFDSRVGCVAAFIYAIIPVAVIHAHFATVDVPATFFIALALAASACLVTKSIPKAIAFAGALCGLAAATKYNCGLVLFAPAAAVLLEREVILALRFRNIFILAGGAIIGFVVGCPGVLLNWSGFWKDFSYELHKSGEGMGLLFVQTGNGWLYHLTSSLRFGMGIPLLAIALTGTVYALIRRTTQNVVLLAFLIPYYLVIGYAQVRFMRYIIPILPVLAILAARLLVDAWNKWRVFGKLLSAGGAGSLAITLLIALSLDHVMAMPDARDQAKAYLDSTAPQGAGVLFARLPWYDVPPLAPEFTAPNPSSRREAARALTRYSCGIPAENTELSTVAMLAPDVPPKYVILSDVATEDWERLRMPEWLEFKKVVNWGRSRRDYQNYPTIFGLDFGKPGYVPNDLLYIYPRISIYERK